MDKAVNKALDRLRQPDARLVLTYVNDGSSVTGRAYFIMPGGHRVMDQTAQQLLERGDVQPFESGLLPGHPQITAAISARDMRGEMERLIP
jgi:hypothetical protein